MPKLPGINYHAAIRALQKGGFTIIREGKHTIMSNGVRIVVLPRHNPINAFTLAHIVKQAGFCIDEFKELL
jgi:predicted RNA binding protein YcfA (HicA-like mRNA interferase family)